MSNNNNNNNNTSLASLEVGGGGWGRAGATQLTSQVEMNNESRKEIIVLPSLAPAAGAPPALPLGGSAPACHHKKKSLL